VNQDDTQTGPREPILNAPWPAMALIGAMVAAYAWQAYLASPAVVMDLGFAPADLDPDRGRLFSLFTYQFLHGGWPHVGMNAVWALAFAPPVARLLGPRPIGVAAFFAFYLVCGALAAIGFAALHPHQSYPALVGASGAVSGLMGAGSRLLNRWGELLPLRSRNVISMGATWAVINVVLGVIGFAPGMGGHVNIAWEAHIAGYLAGVLLIGPLATVLRRG
jgi:membrane associated rhomboid family serine protease